MGSENVLHLTSGDASFLARMGSAVDPRPGEILPVVVDVHRIYLFDPATQRAIV